MSRPLLLDLFCGAGGAAMGYHRAGFDIVGIDFRPQPNYPFEIIAGDAVRALDGLAANHAGWITAIHASPPCQSFTAYRRKGHGVGDGYPDLVAAVRRRLREIGIPYVIENVPGAPLENPVQLCGTGFGLDVQRHRLFESNVPLMGMPCAHGRHAARFPAATNRAGGSRRTVEIGVWRIPLETQQRAMGIDWMTLEELSEAIPPAYTEHIGGYLMAALPAEVAALSMEEYWRREATIWKDQLNEALAENQTMREALGLIARDTDLTAEGLGLVAQDSLASTGEPATERHVGCFDRACSCVQHRVVHLQDENERLRKRNEQQARTIAWYRTQYGDTYALAAPKRTTRQPGEPS